MVSLMNTNTKNIWHNKKVTVVSSWNHAKQYIAYIDQCTQGLWNNNFMQKFKNTKITVFLNFKTQSHVIQTWYENLALIPIVGKSGFVSHTKHTAKATNMNLFHSWLITRTISISKFKNKIAYLGMVKFKTKDYKYLRTLLIFTPIPLYTQEVWSLN